MKEDKTIPLMTIAKNKDELADHDTMFIERFFNINEAISESQIDFNKIFAELEKALESSGKIKIVNPARGITRAIEYPDGYILTDKERIAYHTWLRVGEVIRSMKRIERMKISEIEKASLNNHIHFAFRAGRGLGWLELGKFDHDAAVGSRKLQKSSIGGKNSKLPNEEVNKIIKTYLDIRKKYPNEVTKRHGTICGMVKKSMHGYSLNTIKNYTKNLD